jgi:hypothetical protein
MLERLPILQQEDENCFAEMRTEYVLQFSISPACRSGRNDAPSDVVFVYSEIDISLAECR